MSSCLKTQRPSHAHSLPVELWPVEDQLRWSRRRFTNVRQYGRSPATRWRDITDQAVRQHFGLFVAWEQHACPRGALSIEDRFSLERISAFVSDLQERCKSVTVINRIVGVERALAVMHPEFDRRYLRTLINQLPKDVDRTEKRSRLQDSADLVECGLELIRRAEILAPEKGVADSILYRDGLQISHLAWRPNRMKNFAHIEIGRNLLRVGCGWELRFTPKETKNGDPIDICYPQSLVPYLEHYLEHHRPRLADGRYHGQRLWVSSIGRPEHAVTIASAIRKHTHAKFGKAITPHLFRDCAATSLAIDKPEAVMCAAAVLGHRTFATTERYYNLATSLEASRSYHSVLSQSTGRAGRARCRD